MSLHETTFYFQQVKSKGELMARIKQFDLGVQSLSYDIENIAKNHIQHTLISSYKDNILVIECVVCNVVVWSSK